MLNGTPIEIVGSTATSGAGAMEKLNAACPVSTAIACSNRKRSTPLFSACAHLELGLYLSHIGLRGDAHRVLVLR
jgi:hypothetical protein